MPPIVGQDLNGETLNAPFYGLVKAAEKRHSLCGITWSQPYLFFAEEAVYCVRHDAGLTVNPSCDTDCDSVATMPVRGASLAS